MGLGADSGHSPLKFPGLRTGTGPGRTSHLVPVPLLNISTYSLCCFAEALLAPWLMRPLNPIPCTSFHLFDFEVEANAP